MGASSRNCDKRYQRLKGAFGRDFAKQPQRTRFELRFCICDQDEKPQQPGHCKAGMSERQGVQAYCTL